MSHSKAQEHFKAALTHIDAQKEPALWNLVSGLIEFAKGANDSDALAMMSEDHTISERLERIEHLLHQMQQDR